MITIGVRDKDAVSSLVLALLADSENGALALQENALTLVDPADLALVTLDLMVASSFTPTLPTIATAPLLETTPDYLLLNPTEEETTPDVSKVLCLPVLLLLALLLTASSSAAVALD